MESSNHNRGMKEKAKEYLLELPCIYLLIVVGFLMEFLIQLPFAVMCTLDRVFSRRKIKGLFSNDPK